MSKVLTLAKKQPYLALRQPIARGNRMQKKAFTNHSSPKLSVSTIEDIDNVYIDHLYYLWVIKGNPE